MMQTNTAQLFYSTFLKLAPSPRDRYRHYKGGEYEVVAMALSEENQTPVVIYRSLVDSVIWSRPLADWLATITTDQGERIKRFARIES